MARVMEKKRLLHRSSDKAGSDMRLRTGWLSGCLELDLDLDMEVDSFVALQANGW